MEELDRENHEPREQLLGRGRRQFTETSSSEEDDDDDDDFESRRSPSWQGSVSQARRTPAYPEAGRQLRRRLPQQPLAPHWLPPSYIRLMRAVLRPGAPPHPRLAGIINDDLEHIAELPAIVLQSAVDWIHHADNKLAT